MNNQDTIAAIATPFGTGGVGIIRVSGPRAHEIAHRIFQPAASDCLWKTHHLYHGHIVSSDGTILDEVLVSLMRKPHSFTGEDILEINCHSSALILQSILALLMEEGCRLAKPGEFSQRAFFNNRIDLSQAEGLATLIAAKSAQAASIGLAQLKGELGAEIDNLRNRLIEVVALLEAEIDFSEDVSEEDIPVLPPQVDQTLARIQLLLSSYNAAKAYTEGMNVVITGKPNVGKSSLLNTLTGKKKAIVTDIPGTTRDLITDTIIVRGIPLNLVDTAGLRAPQCAIEKEGIDLVWEALANADMIVILLDGSTPVTQEDTAIFNKLSKNNYLIAINKSDLPAAWEENEIRTLLSGNKIFKISAKFGAGIDELKEALVESSFTDREEKSGTVMINNIRHKLALEKARDNIIRAKENISNRMSTEFAAFDLREAIDNLDEITGKKIDDEILDKIFSSFCIGK